MLLAETFGRAGLVGEALASLSTGFAFASKNGEEIAGRGVASCARESAGRRRKVRSRPSQLPEGAGGCAAVGFAGVRAKIVDSCRWNGRNHLHRTLLERRLGQSRHIRRENKPRAGQRRAGMSLQQAIAEFRGQFRGIVIEPGDGGYDEARKVYNGMIDRKPR